jgi:predicted permease
MAWLNRLVAGFRGLSRRARAEQELDAELRDFLDRAVDERMRSGMTREAATRAARLQLGISDAVKDRVRDVGWESVVESVWLDGRYAARSLRRSAGFTAACILTLALGIGATTAIFSVLDAVLLKALPVRSPEELVLVSGSQYPVFQAYRQHADIFVDLFATSGVTPLDVELQNGTTERTAVSLVSGSYFSTFGLQPAIGRFFTAGDDDSAGRHAVAVASYGYWQRRFGRDAAVLNQELRISGSPVTIVGVAPSGFFGEQPGVAPDLWVPLAMWGQVVPGRNLLQSPGTGWLRIIGRLQVGTNRSAAQAELTATFRHTVTEIFGPRAPVDVRRDIANSFVTIEPAGKGLSALRTQLARPLQLLMGAVLLVLLIACANIANLLLARATARRRETDVRLALGMSRVRLIRLLLIESLMLAAAGAAFGIAFAWFGREALLRLISADGSRLPVAVAVDTRLLAFLVLISSGTAMLFGLVPALQSARYSLSPSLIVRGNIVSPRLRLRSVLVIAQVAVSLVLMMGAGLFLRTIANLRDVDLGFAPERLLILDVEPEAAGYRGDRAIELSHRLLERIGTLPGVSSVSLSENGVLMGRDSTTNLLHSEGFVAGPEGYPRSRWDVVGPQYFSTMGIRLLSGRDFSEQDDLRSRHVVAINQEMARLFFGARNPVGRRLIWGDGNAPAELEIVAVTRDVKPSGPREEPQSRFYLPYFQMSGIRPNWTVASTRFVVRTAANPAALVPVLRQLIRSEDARLPIASLDVGPELVGRTLVRERAVATLLVVFGALAAGLACLGLYGLIAYQVVQRTGEIGIRMALGARPRHVLWTMVNLGLVWTAAGILIGVPLTLVASRLARGLLFGLSATDPGVLIGAAGSMAAMAVVAAYLPARRALRVDPVVALRAE